MRKFLKQKVVWIVAVAVALALCLSVAAYVRGHSGSFVSDGVHAALSPLESAVASVAGWFEDIYAYLYDFDSLQAENSQLRSQVAELESQLRTAQDAAEENDRLRQLLDLQQRRRDFQFAAARVVSWGASNWGSTFTISAGRDDGLELGDCVITEDGCLVGQITELNTGSAVVRTIIDPATSIGAQVERSGAVGLAQGGFQEMSQGQLCLRYLPETSQLLVGDQILTAGSENFPNGLILGQVESVTSDPGGLESYALIQPAADLRDLNQVFIITDFEIVD